MGFFYSQLFITPPAPKGDFSGKTIILTGSNIGLGREAARHYARMGASNLILAVRSVDKGEEAKADIVRTTGNKNIQVWKLDMSDHSSIEAFAKRAEAELDRIDIFIANAGVARAEYHQVNGFEEQIAVNVIATTLLMANMMPKMRETASRFDTRPTFTITGSASYDHTTFPQRSAPDGQILATLSDKTTCEQYWPQQYPISKLVPMFVLRSIADDHPVSDFPVTLNTVNPGLCWSGLAREATGWGFWLMRMILARSTEVGSRTLVHAGAAGAETHGKYLSDCSIEEPTALVTGAAGKELQDRISSEVFRAIDSIQPGLSRSFRIV